MTRATSPAVSRRLVLAVLGVLVLGCSRVGAAGARTFTDDAGRRVAIPAALRRIVSLAPGHTETLYALGAGARVVVADTYSDYPPEARKKAKLNCWPRPPVEQIVAAKPDLVLVMTEETDFLAQMEAARVPALKLFPKSYEAVLREIALLGKVLGLEGRSELLVRQMRNRTAAVRQRVRGAPPVRVMYEIDGTDAARPYAAGGGGFYGDILRMAGGRNIFADLKVPTAQVSIEQIVARDPEVILGGSSRPAGMVERFRGRDGWQGIAAVRAGRIYPVDGHRLTRASPRLVEGLEQVARVLHPKRFR